MPYQELIILLPCHSLEDFPTYHEGDDAQSLLASWSALWHPELVASAGKMPKWQRIEDPPHEVAERLIVVPSVSIARLPTGFAQRVKDAGGCLIRKTQSRDEIVATALASLGERSERVDADLALDFLALGYCYLQIQLLTRQMRYSSNLDEVYFGSQLVAAATAAVAGDNTEARERLSACFNVLSEERDHYYPVDAYILDLNLLADTTLGADLRTELAYDAPINLLLSAETLQAIERREPATLEALRSRVAADNIGLIGGDEAERRLPLMSLEGVLGSLERGLAIYERVLGRRPTVFGRWRFGLSPMLPAVLHKLGFRGALHTNFEEGKVPDGLQFKVRWEGLDSTAVDAIARPPLDAAKPQTYLTYAVKMGESMDSDHVATVALAHWPGLASPWLADLRRIAAYCGALGKFVTVDQYFKSTDQPGQLDRFEADRYRSPYLRQSIIRRSDDPISTSVRYWQRIATTTSAEAMHTLATLVQSSARTQPSGGVHKSGTLLDEGAPDEIDAQLNEQFTAARDRLADTLGVGRLATDGVLALNPSSHVRRMGVDISTLASLPSVEKPVYAAVDAGEKKFAVVDVPAAGFVWLAAAGRNAKEAKPLLLAEDGVLRNEFFEAVINPTTGTLAALREYKARGNRMSQQLALRTPGAAQKTGDAYRDPDESAVYSVMAADSVTTTLATTAVGEIVAKGRLLNLNGAELATFVQTYRVWRGSRVLEIEVEIDPREEPRADPWNSYYCSRFAWADESSEMFRAVQMTRQPATVKQFEAPHYVDIVTDKHATTILTGGLPFHRKQGLRMLDSLLIVRGERQRKFKFGIGVDLPHPLHEAMNLLSPPIALPSGPPSTGASGWLLHVGARNVNITSSEPILEADRVVGLRLRLLETTGRGVSTSISCFREFQAADKMDFQGNSLGSCTIAEGQIKIDIGPHEWVEVAAKF